MTADRPATEPRTEAGRRLAEADAQALWSPAEVRAAILAIEAEAASPAALDVRRLAYRLDSLFDEHPAPQDSGAFIAHDRGRHGAECWRWIAARLTEQEDRG